jgi:hypothetical protein
VALIQGLDVRNNMYGYIGLEDYMLYPNLRPGSFVQNDPSSRKILRCGWTSEHERPIYFVELRDGYCCSWCDLNREELLLPPHPLSPCKIRRLIHGVDAEIIGRVTGAGISFNNAPIEACLRCCAGRKNLNGSVRYAGQAIPIRFSCPEVCFAKERMAPPLREEPPLAISTGCNPLRPSESRKLPSQTQDRVLRVCLTIRRQACPSSVFYPMHRR